jgi:ABC-type multidrug transport system fused ATPase/permease subunit
LLFSSLFVWTDRDAESEAQVQEAIDALLKSKNRPTVLLVAHRLSTGFVGE